MEHSIEELHKNLLELLKELHQVCNEKNIKYSLFAGTLIGAVREKGFISWDDDADVIMERKEFEKFVHSLPEDYEISRGMWVPRFKRKDDDLFIDIFILDQASTNKKAQQKAVYQIKFLQGMFKNHITTNKGFVGIILSTITYFAGLPFSNRKLIKKYDKATQQFNAEDSHLLFTPYNSFKYVGPTLPKSIVDTYIMVPFESTELMIMKGYDIYLTKYFGDYMTPPPKEEQIPTHGNVKN